LLRLIRAIFEASDGTYGSPRIHAALKDAGEKVAEKRVARLMQEGGLVARIATLYRRASGVRRFFAEIPNLVVGFQTTRVDQLWVGDITYLRSGRRWCYLAVVMDRHSRRIVGWSFGVQRDLALTLAALNDAVRRRRPKPGLIFHSDRGIEYTQTGFRTRLAALGFVQSTKRPTGFGDNAFVESFFHTMKADVIRGHRFANDTGLLAVVRRYIRRYNRVRTHSSLGYRSPIDYEHRAA
jgi:putative transposase